MMEVEASSRRWESEANETIEKAVLVEAERDATRHEASMARLDAEATGSTRMQVESELARVQHALAASAEAWRKAEDEANRLADERVSLLLELGASKDELSAFQAEASKEKNAMEEAFDVGFDVIFNYGYGCCAFVHNICGSEPVIQDGMLDTSKPLPPKFFINPRCPPGAALGVPTTDPDSDVREAGKSLPTVEVGLSIQYDSPFRVTGENEEPDASGGN